MRINAKDMHFKELGEQIRNAKDNEIIIENCIGQRYIADASNGKSIKIQGTPGNALGAYMDGSVVEVFGNVQDAVGDTMNSGKIIVHGNAGDACGYAMRGGTIYVENNAGYRAGIHMKEYQDKRPALIIGNEAGSFLGEYQAGGIIVVLGLKTKRKFPVGRFCGTGMHGGKIFLRCEQIPFDLPEQIVAQKASEQALAEIEGYIKEYCEHFKSDINQIMKKDFYVLKPNSKNPYHMLYTPN